MPVRLTFSEETSERDIPERCSREYRHRIAVWEMVEPGPMTPWSKCPPPEWCRIHVIDGAFLTRYDVPLPGVAREIARREAWDAFREWAGRLTL